MDRSASQASERPSETKVSDVERVALLKKIYLVETVWKELNYRRLLTEYVLDLVFGRRSIMTTVLVASIQTPGLL
jgi:hypothetical protein